MDEEITAGVPVSSRVLEAEFPPEPEGAAVAITHHGTAFQRFLDAPWARGRHDAMWLPVRRPDSFEGRPKTWRELHADGPVIVVWEPGGRDRGDAAALASYRKGPEDAS